MSRAPLLGVLGATLVLSGPAAGGASGVKPPPPTVRYRLAESSRSLTPNGDTTRAFAGTVTVCGEKARWELGAAATFPRARASVLVADGGGLLVISPGDRQAARLPLQELDTLFSVPGSSESGVNGITVTEKSVSVTRDGSGAPFQDLATVRYRVALKAVLSVLSPGRHARVTSETKGVVETADVPGAASPLDDLTRLFTARGEVLEALRNELASKIKGLPVHVTLETASEQSVESVGMSPGIPSGAQKPLRSTSTATRTVSELVVRAADPERDAALFRLGEELRVVGIERLLSGGPGLP